MIASDNMLGLFLAIFIRKSIKTNSIIKIHKQDQIRLGNYNMANKGSLVVELEINHQKISFSNCHLASGTKNSDNERRKIDLKKVVEFRK